jgi:hypothetical protein
MSTHVFQVVTQTFGRNDDDIFTVELMTFKKSKLYLSGLTFTEEAIDQSTSILQRRESQLL